MCQEQALEIVTDPASWIKVYLLRRGWKLRSVRRLIDRSFTQEAEVSAGDAQYDRTMGKVIMGNTIRRLSHKNSFYSGLIIREAGMTPSELARAHEEEQAKNALDNVEMPEFREGDFGGFEFEDNMSLHTLSKSVGTRNRPPPSGLSQTESYTPEARSTFLFVQKTNEGICI